MLKQVLPVFTAGLLFSYASAPAAELVSNGSFESGTFAGWTANVTGNPFIPWLVSQAGGGAGFGILPPQPQDGQYDAWNGFDGDGPMVFSLYQDVKLPKFLASPATLTWKDRLQWNFAVINTATQPRTYMVQVRNANGAVLATLYTFSTGTAHVIGNSGWQTHNANLSAYAGSTIRLWFQEKIPEAFTGPGQFEIDDVSLDVAAFVSIDSCNTGVLNRVADPVSGVMLQEVVSSLVDKCTASARNHGGVVSCVTHGLNELKGSVVTGHEKGAMTSCAAQTSRRGKY